MEIQTEARTVSKSEFEAFMAAFSTRVEEERDTEFWYDNYIDRATDREIGFVCYKTGRDAEYVIKAVE
jgi:hypothetical protein